MAPEVGAIVVPVFTKINRYLALERILNSCYSNVHRSKIKASEESLEEVSSSVRRSMSIGPLEERTSVDIDRREMTHRIVRYRQNGRDLEED